MNSQDYKASLSSRISSMFEKQSASTQALSTSQISVFNSQLFFWRSESLIFVRLTGKLCYFQNLSLGLFRSDYMMTQPGPKKAPRILQVEFNTIASSFGSLMPTVCDAHRWDFRPLSNLFPSTTFQSRMALNVVVFAWVMAFSHLSLGWIN